jgi:hypothetical protein
LAVFASQAFASTVRLSVPVVDRVVVDRLRHPRLVRSVQHTPRHVVLLLHRHEAMLYDGVGATVRPALRSAFPLHPSRDAGDAPWETATQAFWPGRPRLGAYLRLHPAPLVLAGTRTSSSGSARCRAT